MKAAAKDFKMTELGPIPKDWDVKRLGEIGTFSKGSGISRDQAHTGWLPCIRYGEIYTDHNDWIRDFKSHITSEIAAGAKLLNAGDILFAGSGETKEEIGKAVAYLGGEKNAYCGGDILVLSPHSEHSSKYLGYVLNSRPVVVQKASRGQGDAVVHIKADSLAEVSAPIPPLPEQRKIAAALSDVDEMIAALEKLIEKKRKIKIGAMQELLGTTPLCTSADSAHSARGEKAHAENAENAEKRKEMVGFVPRRRLPCFTGKWVEKRLGKVLQIGHGKDYKHLQAGMVPVYGTGGLMTYVNEYLYDGETVCIGRKGTIDRPFYHEGKIWTVDTLFFTHSFVDVVPRFLAYMFEQVDWLSYNEATGVPSLTSKAIEDIVIVVPPTLAEQKAIAKVLGDMDEEIAALEAELAKARQLKQGMMQELLTGKVRLV